MEQRFRVGVFASTHGIKGEINVFPTTDSLERFDSLKEVMLETKEGIKNLTVEHVKYHKGMAILKFKEIDSINDIERYKGSSLLVTRENAVKLAPDRYYIADLIGMTVITDDGRTLGTLSDVMTTAANDVFIVNGEKNGKPKEYLIPHIKSCVLNISLEESRILVHMLDGLEDL